MKIDKSIGNWYTPKSGDEALDYQLDVIYQLYLNDNKNNNKISSQADVILYYYHKEKNMKYGMIEYDMKYYTQSENIIRKEKLLKLKNDK